MRTWMWCAALMLGPVLAAPALLTKTDLAALPVCKALGCKQTKRYTATNDIMGRFIHAVYSTPKGYELQADYSPKGELVGVDITLRRNPIDEADKKVILQLLENVTGSRYTASVLDKCFAEAQNKATMEDFFSGQTGLASGETAAGAPWGALCWTFVKPYSIVNRVYINFAYR